MEFERPFVLDLLKGIKDFYQAPFHWENHRKNNSIFLGYCMGCDALVPLTNSREYRLDTPFGTDYKTLEVPLQCYMQGDKNVMQFSVEGFDYFLRYIDFVNKNSFQNFHLVFAQDKWEKYLDKPFSNDSYSSFVKYLDAWPEENLIHFGEEVLPLRKLYGKWNSLDGGDKILQAYSLHKLSKNYAKAWNNVFQKIEPFQKILYF